MAEYLIQDTTLLAIADAIREKEGSTGSILVSDFAARIRALSGGSGGELFSFTYNDSTTYYFESGMTWEEWIDSEYNTGGFNSAYTSSLGAWGEYVYDGDGEPIDYAYSRYVLVTETIVPYGDYGCMR